VQCDRHDRENGNAGGSGHVAFRRLARQSIPARLEESTTSSIAALGNQWRNAATHLQENAMDPRIAPLTEILRMNTKLFRSCLGGVTEEMAAMRPSSSTNSVAFVASHLTEARFYVLGLIGARQKSPLAAYLEMRGASTT
jgi:hypothetical protein